MQQPSLVLSTRPSGQVDGALVQLRWVLGLVAWGLIALSARSPFPSEAVLAWICLLVSFNLILFLLLRSKTLPRSLPIWGLLGDVAFFGLLPYLAPANAAILFLFGLYPTVVAALRYGPAAGAAIALALTLPYELRALASFLPVQLSILIPALSDGDVTFLSAGLPVLALFAVVVLVGYLAQREREALVGDTAVELEQLRRGMAGAKLFYTMTDTLSQTLSYSHVLEAMLEAGTEGMPAARKEDGPPVGLTLLFQPNDPDKNLEVVAWRNLDRSDTHVRAPGRQGVIAQACKSGEPVTFANAGADPELSLFGSLRRCRAGICFPLQAGLNVYGVVVLATPAPRGPTEQHIRLMLAFTNQAAVAFQNARLFQSLRQERDHIVDAEAAARAKLARDLHDGPTQALAALAMQLDYVGALLDKEPETARQELRAAREQAVGTGKELRELLFTLRPLTLETQGLSQTLLLWAQRLRDSDHVQLDLEPGGLGPELDARLAGAVFAIIEEAVNNARKHATGAAIHVSVCQQDRNLVAVVQDEGPGFDITAVESTYDRRGSLGLVNMRERARLLDGQLSIDSAPGRGTRVTLIAPLGGRSG